MEKCTDYWVKGDTYPIKEELKEWGCFWVPEKKIWKVQGIVDRNDTVYKGLKGLGCELVPVKLDPELQNIQNILSKT